MNIWYENKDTQDIVNAVNKVKPKIIAMVEANPQIVSEISEKYDLPRVWHDNFFYSCVIWSESEPVEARIIKLTYPICYAKFPNFDLFVVHPLPPMTLANRDKQIQHFQELKTLIRKKNFILI